MSSVGAGRRLSAAREQWGLSVQEAAQSLNLSVDIIRALEEDAYERLPGSPFAVGYLRAYAKLLKLDHEEIAAGLSLVTDQVQKIPYADVPGKHPAHRPLRSNKRGGWFFRTLLIIVVLTGLSGVVVLAVNQFSGVGVNKVLAVLGLSPQVSPGEKSFGTPLPTENPSSGALQD